VAGQSFGQSLFTAVADNVTRNLPARRATVTTVLHPWTMSKIMNSAANHPDPFFKVARIVYFTDQSVAGAPIIPLGSFGEVMLPHVHGLALKARSALTEEELQSISPLSRWRIENPFKFLRAEFDLAWERSRYGRALEFLTRKHSASLSVLAPTDVHERQSLLQTLLPPRAEAVEGNLSAAVDQELSELMKAHGDHVAAERKVVEVDIDRAAAA
jgi:hypothetical protein